MSLPSLKSYRLLGTGGTIVSVNLGSHILVADTIGHSKQLILLGSALPDIASIGRFNLVRPTSNSELATGIALHHATDEVFHRSEWFRARSKNLYSQLTDSAKIGRGPAKACAHVGIELLLDGTLLNNNPAMATIIDEVINQIDYELPAMSEVVDSERQADWQQHLKQFPKWRRPTNFHQPHSVAQALHRILSGRPRLSFETSAIGAVTSVLETVSDSITETASDHLTQIAEEVAEVRR